MSPEAIIVLLAGSLVILLMLGLPVAFITGGIGAVLMTLFWGPDFLMSMITNTLKTMSSFLLVAVPLFILMGSILESSGIAEELYAALHAWTCGIRGGLAMGTVVICAIIAAMVGVAGAEIVVMGLVALPNMFKYKYDKKIVLGTICAAGTLAQLIPPSTLFIFYGAEAGVSIGSLFKAGIPAGLLIAGIFIIYIGIRSYLQKDLCPVVPVEDRSDFKTKVKHLKALVMPGILISLVLGSIFTGAATPSEAAGVGAIGAAVCALAKGKFNWGMMKRALIITFRANSMIMWIMIGAKAYATVMIAGGVIQLIQDAFMNIPFGPVGILILMMFILFVLGCFLDPITIVIITVPVFLPIVKNLGFDPVWFGVLFVANLQLGYVTPPFGMSLFYLKGIAPKEITLNDIYRSVLPFVLLEVIGIALIITFPQLIMWIV